MYFNLVTKFSDEIFHLAMWYMRQNWFRRQKTYFVTKSHRQQKIGKIHFVVSLDFFFFFFLRNHLGFIKNQVGKSAIKKILVEQTSSKLLTEKKALLKHGLQNCPTFLHERKSEL